MNFPKYIKKKKTFRILITNFKLYENYNMIPKVITVLQSMQPEF